VAASPFDHPDAQRRFRVVANVGALQRALELAADAIEHKLGDNTLNDNSKPISKVKLSSTAEAADRE
jgi:hypothetical protein